MSSQTDEEIIAIINELTGPRRSQFSLSFLTRIRAEIANSKRELDQMNFEFTITKFDDINCEVSNEIRLELLNSSMDAMMPRRIEFIKKIRTWFNDHEGIFCSLSAAKTLVERIIR